LTSEITLDNKSRKQQSRKLQKQTINETIITDINHGKIITEIINMERNRPTSIRKSQDNWSPSSFKEIKSAINSLPSYHRNKNELMPTGSSNGHPRRSIASKDVFVSKMVTVM
jgi:Rps23 Pro-64 3,4-dihydroxylase Tpa1-like proline 4-hydroxylase